jgi:hypothetical protein
MRYLLLLLLVPLSGCYDPYYSYGYPGYAPGYRANYYSPYGAPPPYGHPPPYPGAQQPYYGGAQRSRFIRELRDFRPTEGVSGISLTSCNLPTMPFSLSAKS